MRDDEPRPVSLPITHYVSGNVVCVFYYCRTYYKAVRVGGGGEWRTCAMRDDEPRPVWMSLPITHWNVEVWQTLGELCVGVGVF
jgi:hypothetical protein